MAPKKTAFEQLKLPFGERVEKHLKDKEKILTEISTSKPLPQIESYEEACILLAMAMKDAIRESGLSREQVTDGINQFFGWEEKDKVKKRGEKGLQYLSVHMMNHYLSKPVEYPIPGPILFAFNHVTGSLATCRAFVKAEDGDVITQDEKQELLLGKLEKTIFEMQKLKKEFKGKK